MKPNKIPQPHTWVKNKVTLVTSSNMSKNSQNSHDHFPLLITAQNSLFYAYAEGAKRSLTPHTTHTTNGELFRQPNTRCDGLNIPGAYIAQSNKTSCHSHSPTLSLFLLATGCPNFALLATRGSYCIGRKYSNPSFFHRSYTAPNSAIVLGVRILDDCSIERRAS